jgi:hypothetical protein
MHYGCVRRNRGGKCPEASRGGKGIGRWEESVQEYHYLSIVRYCLLAVIIQQCLVTVVLLFASVLLYFGICKGTGESGKSTVVKQMQIMHKNGFTEHEKKYLLPIINMNIIECLCILLKQIETKGLTYVNPANEVPSCPALLLVILDSSIMNHARETAKMFY